MSKIVIVAALFVLATAPAQAKPVQAGSAQQGQLILYQLSDFAGDDYVIAQPRLTLMTDWNIRSIAIHPGDKWQVCAKRRFAEPCITLTESLPDASVVGINGQIGSVRMIK